MLPCFVLLDLETTGGSPVRDRITEIAAVRIDPLGDPVTYRIDGTEIALPRIQANQILVDAATIREIALPRFTEGFDAVLVGHSHHVYERREPGREFFLLGDWMERFTYVELTAGKLELRTWPAPA